MKGDEVAKTLLRGCTCAAWGIRPYSDSNVKTFSPLPRMSNCTQQRVTLAEQAACAGQRMSGLPWEACSVKAPPVSS